MLLVIALTLALASMVSRVHVYNVGVTTAIPDPYRATPFRIDGVIFGSCAALLRHLWPEAFSSIFRSTAVIRFGALGLLYVATRLDLSMYGALGSQCF